MSPSFTLMKSRQQKDLICHTHHIEAGGFSLHGVPLMASTSDIYTAPWRGQPQTRR